MPSDPKPRGRPKSATALSSAATNYEALAWQVFERVRVTKEVGKRITIKAAVRVEMLEAIRSRNDEPARQGAPLREGLVETKVKTAYTEVRKILRRWKRQTTN
ncbi:MAG: hypothetical protein ACREXY_00495 [Gammaproteobacteria bacterium]